MLNYLACKRGMKLISFRNETYLELCKSRSNGFLVKVP